eukprot:TRINITY_DN19135_c0_g1_i1.p1 TRINITY_DN19135_c0_g1~~TRINITY_DN19135_c0_g1_i1.p1  ORF type:complete len:184 (+),score=32.89 TRINITY_DN19135_c0_g1_i1:28-579(+)
MSSDEGNVEDDIPNYLSHHQGSLPREQDRFLPIANISRIMKKALPNSAKIAKDAKETVQECVSEFISFITSEASDKCQNEKRKTINGEDILWAMQTLGFDNYVEPLKTYLHKFREEEKNATRRMPNKYMGDKKDILECLPSPTLLTPLFGSNGYIQNQGFAIHPSQSQIQFGNYHNPDDKDAN